MASRTDLGIDLRLKLLWLSVFRMVATTLVLAALAIRLLSGVRGSELSNEDSLSFVVIGAVYLVTLVYAVTLRRGQPGRGWAYGQLLGDVALATSLVYLTGGAESPFSFMYLLAVVAGSILLYQRGALLVASASAVAFVGLTLALQNGVLRVPEGGWILPPGRLAFILASNLLAQFLIAALAGYLSRQLRATDGRLSERESDLRQLATFQRQILAAMPSGLITCNDAGRTTFVNRAAEVILCVDRDSVVGGPLDALLPGVHAMVGTKRNTLEVVTPGGPRTLGLSVSSLQDPPGSLLIVFQDLTQLRRMEEELKRADSLAALGKLSAQLAHEIRNPLAAMRGSAQMLSAKPEGAVVERLANILVRESDRLANLLEEFLRFARPPEPNRKVCSLKKIVSETLEMLQADPLGQRVALETDLPAASAYVDPDQIRQVLVNLVRNAWAAAGSEGRVRVSVVPTDIASEIRVWDSAGSISAENLDRIFEPFFTTRSGGTGLGLSAAYSIIRAHEGTIRVQSSPQRGTEFVITLPETKEPVRADIGG